MENSLEFKYGDSEQFIDYKSGDKLDINFPSGAIFFVGSNEGMVFCNKVNIFKEEMGDIIHTKIQLSNNDTLVGVFFADIDKNLQIILSSDDTVFKAVFIYNAF